MANDYSKYKLYRKYKTEDGVNYTPLDEYQAVYESGGGVDCDCGYRLTKYVDYEPMEYKCSSEIDSNWVDLKDNIYSFKTIRIDTNNYSFTPTYLTIKEMDELLVNDNNRGYGKYQFQTIRFDATGLEGKELRMIGNDCKSSIYNKIVYEVDNVYIVDFGLDAPKSAITKIDDNIYEYTWSHPFYVCERCSISDITSVSAKTSDYISFNLVSNSGTIYVYNENKYGISLSKGKIYDNGAVIDITSLLEVSDGVYEYTFSTILTKSNIYISEELENRIKVLNYNNIYVRQKLIEYCPDDERYDKVLDDEHYDYRDITPCDCGNYTYKTFDETDKTYTADEVENAVYLTDADGNDSLQYIDEIAFSFGTNNNFIYFKSKTNKITFYKLSGNGQNQVNYGKLFVDNILVDTTNVYEITYDLEGDENTIHTIHYSGRGSTNPGTFHINSVIKGFTFYPKTTYKMCGDEKIEVFSKSYYKK